MHSQMENFKKFPQNGIFFKKHSESILPKSNRFIKNTQMQKQNKEQDNQLVLIHK